MKTIFFGYDQQGPPDARKNFLEMAGYRVRSFANSAALVAAVANEAPDAVVMDVLMEGRNGFEVAEELNTDPQRPYPILLCSRFYRTRGFREHARRCGVTEFLLTPVSLQELLGHVNKAIRDYGPRMKKDEAA